MAETRATVREAKVEDCEGIEMLIKELAECSKMPDGPKVNAETLRQDGFGPEKLFRCFVADAGDKLVGYAMFYFLYSSWVGVNAYMEDLYVTPTYRNQGLGIRLWQQVAKVAVEKGCTRLDWICLDWNKAAMDFYKSKGAVNLTADEGWNHFRLGADKLKEFASN